MAKSKQKRKSRQKAKRTAKPRSPPLMLVKMQKLAQAGYQIRAFEIVDDVGVTIRREYPTRSVKAGRMDEAKAAFERVIKREPRVKEAYANLAMIYSK